MQKLGLYIIIVLSIICGANSATAQDKNDESYHTLYGDGLRLYAEGRYDHALERLYRAYALKPSDLLLKLIVRSHDFMGHCSAAERQLEFFSELYPRSNKPKLQRCESTGTLEIQCSPHAGEVVVDHMIRAACGATLRLPPGEHRVQSPQLNEIQTFIVQADTNTVAQLKLNPEKWFRAQKPDMTADSNVTVLETPDGKYQIWVRSNLRRDPEMEDETPGFTVVRTRDGLYDISSDALRRPYEGGRPSDENGLRKAPTIPSISP